MRKVLPCTYRSQRDNAITPEISCNTTSAVMVLEASRHYTSEIMGLPNNMQPEDFLTQIADSKAAYAKMKVLAGDWAFDKNGKPLYHPAEVAVVLDWIVAQAYGKTLMAYLGGITFGVIMDNIDRGEAVLLHGTLTPAGHYVACVGYEGIQDVGGKVGQLTGLVIDDPWGVYPEYTDHNGEHVLLPLNAAVAVLKPQGSVIKSGHLIVA
jgi:hypothetical protein